jgi:hypothetical protein
MGSVLGEQSLARRQSRETQAFRPSRSSQTATAAPGKAARLGEIFE